MKTLLAALALGAIALPAAAHAADEKMACCCEKMKQEGKECCKDDKVAPAPGNEHAGHGDHHPEAPKR